MKTLEELMAEEPQWDAPAERAPLQAGPYAEPEFRENCPKCRGTGRFRHYGQCFTCKGRGYRAFKTSPEARQAAREGAANRKAAKLQAWIDANPQEWAWINAKAPTFQFAGSILQTVLRYHDLSERQFETVRRLMAQDAERQAARQAERAEREAQAAAIDITPIETAFANAKGKGVRYPKLRLGEFIFKLARKGYVAITRGDEYLGKVEGGKFFAARACDAPAQDAILAACADPKQAGIAYGQRFGSCCVCGRELTNHTSIDAGIGPICAAKYGWA